MSHYYTTQQKNNGYYGIVYHWDDAGQNEIIDFKSEQFDRESEAIDAACQWVEDNDIDAEME